MVKLDETVSKDSSRCGKKQKWCESGQALEVQAIYSNTSHPFFPIENIAICYDIYFDGGFITYAIVNSPESEFCQVCPAPTRTKSYTRIDSFIEIGLKPQAVTPDF